MKNPRNRIALSALSIAAIFSSSPSFAATSSWLDSPSTASWNSIANWSSLPQSGDSLIFGSSSQTTLTNDLTDASFVVSSITFNPGASGYTITGGTIALGISTPGTILANNSSNYQTISSNIVLGNALQTVDLSGQRITLSGTISGSGANSGLSVTSSVKRSLILSRANTYTGNTAISGNGGVTLSFSAGYTTNNIISTSSKLVMGDMGTLTVSGAASKANSQTFNGATLNPGSATIAVTQGSGGSVTLDLGAITRATGATLNFSTAPATTGNVVKTANTNTNGLLGTWASVGAGTTLSYSTVNGSGQIVAYTGGTQITGGASLMTDTTGTANYNVVVTGNTTINTAAVSANTVRNASAASYTTTLGNTLTTNGLMNASGGLWIITSGTIKSGSAKELVIQASTGGQSVQISSVIADSDSGASALTYSGPNSLTLSGANTYSGATYINGGPVVISAANGFGNSQNIYLVGSTLTTSNTFDLGSSRALAFSAGGGITVNSGTLTVSGAVSTSGSLTIAGVGGLSITGDISGDGGLNKTNNTLLTLAGNNTYTGATTISSGTLELSGTLANSAVTVSSGAIFKGNGKVGSAVNNSGAITGSLVFDNDVTINNGATAQVGALNGNITNNGLITSDFTVKSGKALYGSGTSTGSVNVSSGTIEGTGLKLTGAATFDGTSFLKGTTTASSGYTVNTGKLTVTGTTASGVNIRASATMEGTGTVGAVSVSGTLAGTLSTGVLSGSGLVSPGNSPGILTTTGLTAGNSLSFAFELATAAPNYGSALNSLNDVLHVTQSASGLNLSNSNHISIYFSSLTSATLATSSGAKFEGTFYVEGLSGESLLSAFESTQRAYYVVDSDSTVDATDVTFNGTRYALVDPDLITVSVRNYSSSAFSTSNSASTLEFTVVPEPSTWVMLLGGVGLLAFGQRLRRRYVN